MNKEKGILKIRQYFRSNDHLRSGVIADHAGVLRQRMSDFIKGRREPSDDQVAAINNAIDQLTAKQSKNKVK